MWSEVSTANKENRRELVLTGKDVAKRISETGFDENVFDSVQLNFLEITRVGLFQLSPKVGHLINLTSLALHCNKLDEIPSTLGKLTKLKLLDVSMNNLTSLPEEISTLEELLTLNASGNQLTAFVDVSKLTKLHHLDVSNNKLVELPRGVDSAELESLLTISALNNEIKSLPENLHLLSSLKVLDISNNHLEALPPQLGECGKLKDLRCTGNKLKDNRLMKLVNQCSTKAVLDYLKSKVPETGGGAKSKKGKKGGNSQKCEDVDKDVVKILPFKIDRGLMVNTTNNITKVRPYIICCIVRNLNFNKSTSLMSRFIRLQTKLHDGICVKRQVATIATHDLEKLKGPLIYDAVEPKKLIIKPLKKAKEISAEILVERLVREAEEARKARKRNTVSGVHKYLNLLLNHPVYPCVVDASNVTISFPPIINSEYTKVTEATRHILVEVTGGNSLDLCKKVMDELLIGLLEMGVCQEVEPPLVTTNLAMKEETLETNDKQPPDDSEDDSDENELVSGRDPSKKLLIVEQVKVVDQLNNLKVIYPSRTDLQSNKFNIVRESDKDV